MLTISFPHETPSRLAEWSIGRRDSALLTLRAQLFGEELRSVERCPQCGDRVELDLSVRDIQVDTPRGDEPIRFETVEHAYSLRRPTSVDLLAIAQLPSARAQKTALLNRCVRLENNPADELPQLSDEQQAAVVDRLAAVDPQADVRLSIDCFKCGHAWSARFDIVQFLWAEIHTWAQRMLAEVHSLALAYGWSELEILAMTPWRRQVYLEMLRQ